MRPAPPAFSRLLMPSLDRISCASREQVIGKRKKIVCDAVESAALEARAMALGSEAPEHVRRQKLKHPDHFAKCL